jgi:para-aminobenzoate synthetase component 1
MTQTFSVTDFPQLKQKVLNWVQQFNTFCFLDNHQYHIEPHTQECLLAAGVKRKLIMSAGTALSALQSFIDAKKDGWLFGHLGYDLKNELEKLSSDHPDHIGFPDLYFFEPAILIKINEAEWLIEADDPQKIVEEINAMVLCTPVVNTDIKISNRIKKEEYIAIIEQLRQHILRGDCYEINFCQEFFAEHATIDPLQVYLQLSAISPNPFSAFYRLDDKWLLCASPERFLNKQGSKLLSQPIKGTSKRIPEDAVKDKQTRDDLYASSKDRSENVMVVDLVRNDLAKVCQEGTVKVEELYGIYSFPQVHQMISTVSGQLKENTSFSAIIKAMFPMGSMTGAPKKRVMELIEKYETTRRSIFSGAIGYISPQGDFDFNVVIRSIFYNDSSRYLSFLAGSGITFYSNPINEWDECLIKAAAMKQALKQAD